MPVEPAFPAAPDPLDPAPVGTTPGTTTLGSADYCSPEIHALDLATAFGRGWVYACHLDRLPAGSRRVVEIGGQSVIVSRHGNGTVHALANVCRHRGAQLCPAAVDADAAAPATPGPVRCGYHGWTYGLDGSLLATPRLGDELDRSGLGLWSYRTGVWNGLVFVSLASDAPPLTTWLARTTPAVLAFADLPMDGYRVGAVTRSTVACNWKIVQENYAECLHCAVVHPELVDLVPVYRRGLVVDPTRTDTAVELASGARTVSADGRSARSLLPGLPEDRTRHYDGAAVFPNLMLDVTPTCLILTALTPEAPDRTSLTTEYLFAAADVEAPGFDPAAEVDFNELVGRQDATVCEMVQRGVASAAFAGGVLSSKDAGVADFVRCYLEQRHLEQRHLEQGRPAVMPRTGRPG